LLSDLRLFPFLFFFCCCPAFFLFVVAEMPQTGTSVNPSASDPAAVAAATAVAVVGMLQPKFDAINSEYKKLLEGVERSNYFGPSAKFKNAGDQAQYDAAVRLGQRSLSSVQASKRVKSALEESKSRIADPAKVKELEAVEIELDESIKQGELALAFIKARVATIVLADRFGSWAVANAFEQLYISAINDGKKIDESAFEASAVAQAAVTKKKPELELKRSPRQNKYQGSYQGRGPYQGGGFGEYSRGRSRSPPFSRNSRRKIENFYDRDREDQAGSRRESGYYPHR